MNILKPKMAKMQVLGPKFSKMTAPNFWSNSLCGASTVFKEIGQTKGGPHKTPPRSYKLQNKQPFEATNGHLEFKNGHPEAPLGHFEAQNGYLETKIGHLEAKT